MSEFQREPEPSGGAGKDIYSESIATEDMDEDSDEYSVCEDFDNVNGFLFKDVNSEEESLMSSTASTGNNIHTNTVDDVPLEEPFCSNRALYAALLKIPDIRMCFLPKDEQTLLFNSLTCRSYAPGETIIAEGEASTELYFVISGAQRSVAEVEIVRQVNRAEKLVTCLGPGRYFGERYFLTRRNTNRNATVRVPARQEAGGVQLAVLAYDSFPLWENFRQYLLIKKVPLFATLSLGERNELFNQRSCKVFEAEEYIIRQGEVGSEFFVVLEGSVNVIEGVAGAAPRVFITLHAGHFFGMILLFSPFSKEFYTARTHFISLGEMALLTDKPRVADVMAMDRTICLCLSKTQFKSALSNEAFNDIINRYATDRQSARKTRRECFFSDETRKKARSASSLMSSGINHNEQRNGRRHLSLDAANVMMTPPKALQSAALVRTKSDDGKVIMNGYKVIKFLGKGSHGRVALVENISAGGLFAMKTVTQPRSIWSPRASATVGVAKEMEILRAMGKSDYVISLIDVIEDLGNKSTFLIFELMAGTLMHESEYSTPFTEPVCWRYSILKILFEYSILLN